MRESLQLKKIATIYLCCLSFRFKLHNKGKDQTINGRFVFVWNFTAVRQMKHLIKATFMSLFKSAIHVFPFAWFAFVSASMEMV